MYMYDDFTLMITHRAESTSSCRTICLRNNIICSQGICAYAQSRKTMYIWFKRLIIQHGYFTFIHVAGLYIIVDKCNLLPYKVKLIPNCKFL